MNNKKIIALGLLAGFFLMNKKEETPTNNSNNNTGGGTGSGSFGGSSGGGPSAGGGANSSCPAYYVYNGQTICETLLPDYNFFWWKGGIDGDGWYELAQFGDLTKKAKMRGITEAELLADWIATASDTSNSNYVTVMNNLRMAYLGGGPLAAA